MKRIIALLIAVLLFVGSEAHALSLPHFFFMRFLGMQNIMTPKEKEEKKPEEEKTEVKLQDNLYDFGLDALNRLYEKENMVISPLSAVEASAMMMNGAEGDTLKELEKYFGDSGKLTENLSKLNSEKQPELKIANSMWLSFAMKDNFVKLNKEKLNAEVFKGVESTKINKWVRDKTDKMIDGIVDKSVDGRPAVLVNALAFEAEWEHKYEGEYYKADFTDISGKKNNVDFMYFSDDKVYVANDKAEGFIKYYDFDKKSDIKDYNAIKSTFPEGGRFKFMAIMPKDAKAFNDYVKSLNSLEIKSLLNSHEKYSKDKVEIEMPKFKQEFFTSLKDLFKENGVKKAFDGKNADFKKMYEGAENLYIDDILQKTFVSTDKDGTKAASATAIVMRETSMRPEDNQVVHRVSLNRPFVYIISDQFNNPVFMGVVTNIK